MTLRIAVLKERANGEARIAATPEMAGKFGARDAIERLAMQCG